MRKLKLTTVALPGLALGLAALLVLPAEEVAGFTTIGGSLSLAQRDLRVFNNFADSAANDNVFPDTQFPGFDGAEMAVWKSGVEWGSRLHGNGNGDPSQVGDLGSGGANFDFAWAGNANGIGDANANIVSALANCGGGTLAFTETPISNGWRIRFCDNWLWSDGPGFAFGNQFDIQGVSTHELGHALGLGHSSTGTVMQPGTASGNDTRDLAVDDQNGVRSIYGIASAGKPRITAIAVNTMTNTVTITGTNFSATGNEVWFTNAAISSQFVADPLVKVTGISSSAGGTQISLTIPAGAGSGDVLVKQVGLANSNLSNAFPIDTGGGGGPGFGITSIVPSNIDALIPGTSHTITINGNGFTPQTIPSVNGMDLVNFPAPYTFVNSTTIIFDMPLVNTLGPVTIGVTDGGQSDSTTATVVAPATPKLQLGSGDPGAGIIQSQGITFLVSGQPGAIHLLVYSRSNLPSVLPGVVSLSLGNNFIDVPIVGFFTVGAPGWSQFLIPLSGTITPFSTFFSQGINLSTGSTPFQVSNLQEILVLF